MVLLQFTSKYFIFFKFSGSMKCFVSCEQYVIIFIKCVQQTPKMPMFVMVTMFWSKSRSCPPSQAKRKPQDGYSSNGSGKLHPGDSGSFAYECRSGVWTRRGCWVLNSFLSNNYIVMIDLSTLLQGVTTALDFDEGNSKLLIIVEQR